MSETKALIQVFARAPLKGAVKRRLGAQIGDSAALHWYKILLAQTLAVVDAVQEVQAELWYPEGDDEYLLSKIVGRKDLPLLPQAPGDLGEKMQQALTQGLAGADKVLLIGADCPVWTPDLLRQALGQLSSSKPCIIVPAEDGGYVGIGVTGQVPKIFDEVPWGTATVLAKTQDRAAALGYPLYELPSLWDVDVKTDLERWLRLDPKLPRPIA